MHRRFDESEFEMHAEIVFPSTCRTTILNIDGQDADTSGSCCEKAIQPDDASTAQEREMINEVTSYFECKIAVKGFKDQLVKGVDIWTT